MTLQSPCGPTGHRRMFATPCQIRTVGTPAPPTFLPGHLQLDGALPARKDVSEQTARTRYLHAAHAAPGLRHLRAAHTFSQLLRPTPEIQTRRLLNADGRALQRQGRSTGPIDPGVALPFSNSSVAANLPTPMQKRAHLPLHRRRAIRIMPLRMPQRLPPQQRLRKRLLRRRRSPCRRSTAPLCGARLNG